jgi:isoleucyl-tRNA synthetase
MPELVTFITELTNWYVRLNRDRMKDVSDTTSLQVLYDCLLDITILMAPFCPFITEYFYQHLRKLEPSFKDAANGGGKANPVMAGKSDSVHFLRLPSFDESRLSETAVKGMQLLQTVVKCGRDAREKRLLSLKMPVKTLVVCCPNESDEVRENVKTQLASYIKTELNAWEIKFVDGDEESQWVKVRALFSLRTRSLARARAR